MEPARDATSIAETLDAFVKAFDENDLDRAMAQLAENAVYCTFEGDQRVGLAAIRRQLEPQFSGAFGAMRFDELDRFIDEKARRAATRWVCRHDLSHGASPTLSLKIERAVVSGLIGRRFGWEGADVYEFDAAGKIVGIHTFAKVPRRPRIRRDLGMPLPAPGRPTRA